MTEPTFDDHDTLRLVLGDLPDVDRNLDHVERRLRFVGFLKLVGQQALEAAATQHTSYWTWPLMPPFRGR